MVDGLGLLNSSLPVASEKNRGTREPASGEKTFANELRSKSALEPKPKMQMAASKKKNSTVAMESFLKEMQKEFGISPDEVLQAFSNLSLEELSASPENSAENIIASFELEPADANKALGFYYEMLAAMTAPAGVAAASSSTEQIKTGRDVNIQVMNSNEDRIKKLQSAVGDMSDKFFNSGKYVQQTQQTQQTQLNLQNQNIVPPFDQALEKPLVKPSAEQLIELSATDKTTDANLTELISPESENIFNQFLKKPSQQLVSNSLSIEQPSIQAPVQAPAPAPLAVSNSLVNANTQQLVNVSNSASTEPAGTTLGKAAAPSAENSIVYKNLNMADPQNMRDGFGENQSDLDDSEKENSMNSEGYRVDGEQVKTQHTGKDAFILNGPKPTMADMQANIREIISQAEFLASKGGGEMKISLNPEGMGEVKLRVKSIEGQINIEMITSSSESKKLLEKGLSELKDNFTAQKLNLDSVRIESGREISHHMNDPQKDFNRGQQERFLGDFRERNNNFKREMFEFGAPSVPASQTRDQASNVIYGLSARKNRNANSGSSKRLDLVA